MQWKDNACFVYFVVESKSKRLTSIFRVHGINFKLCQHTIYSRTHNKACVRKENSKKMQAKPKSMPELNRFR